MKAQSVLSLFCVGFALSCLLFAYTSAVTEYSTIKPFVARLVPKASEVPVVSFTFTGAYDPTLDRYGNCTVGVQNVGTENRTLTATVELFNAASPRGVIAYGQRQFYAEANITTFINVPLQWTGNYKLRDYADGQVTVS